MSKDEARPKPKHPHVRVELNSDFANYPDIVPRVVSALIEAGVSQEGIAEFVLAARGDQFHAARTAAEWVVLDERRLKEKRILLEYLGGDWDGRILDSHSPDFEEANNALSYYSFTENGTPGHAYHGISMAQVERIGRREQKLQDVQLRPGMKHKYTVIERLEEGNEILVRLQYSVSDGNRRSADD